MILLGRRLHQAVCADVIFEEFVNQTQPAEAQPSGQR
jgi:hypothetical protein